MAETTKASETEPDLPALLEAITESPQAYHAQMEDQQLSFCHGISSAEPEDPGVPLSWHVRLIGRHFPLTGQRIYVVTLTGSGQWRQFIYDTQAPETFDSQHPGLSAILQRLEVDEKLSHAYHDQAIAVMNVLRQQERFQPPGF